VVHDLAVARHYLAHRCCAVPPVQFCPLRLAEQHLIKALNWWLNIPRKMRIVEVSIQTCDCNCGRKARFKMGSSVA
jgi:hypothetical protein